MRDDIQWITKSHTYIKGKHAPDGIDVKITIAARNVKLDADAGRDAEDVQYRTNIVFYNDSEQKISHTDYMVCGVAQNRLYFREDYLQKGYKIQHPKRSATARIVLSHPLPEFEGMYILERDREKDLWYIERTNNLFGEV
jgi:hypothetical protein